jgi:hypothetical protein
MATEAFAFARVPPTTDARPTAAADEWSTTERTSPAAKVRIACPAFCWVPAPDRAGRRS